MKKILLTFLLFPLSAFSVNTSVEQVALQAEALWEAQDYSGAEALYNQLNAKPLPNWQQVRLRYNLATIQLAKNQTAEAIGLFRKIAPHQLSLPRFSRNLFLNEGIAYLQYEKTLAPNTPFHDQQLLYLHQSIDTLEKAQMVGCQLQQTEQGKKEFACSPQQMIEEWMATAFFELDTLQVKHAQKWMASASIESLATLLSILLQQLISEAKSLPTQHRSTHQLAPWIAYFQRQTMTFDSFWQALKHKNLSPAQHISFNEADTNFKNVLQAFSKNDLSSATTSLAQTLVKLKPLCFKEDTDILLAHLNYTILLLQPNLATGDIQTVQWEVDQLKGTGEQSEIIEKIKKYIKFGLEAHQQDDAMRARFFLLAGFSQLDSILPVNHSTSLSSLQQALDQANRSFYLVLLSQLISREASTGVNQLEILKEAQALVLQSAKRFIEAVLKEQEALFHDPKTPDAACLESPWNQVIPLFDHGYLAAKSAEKLLAASTADYQVIAAQQEQTLQDWQQTLNLLNNPPPQKEQKRSGSTSSATPKNLAETYRLIQEMYLEDQSKPQPVIGELHSW